MTTNLRKRFAGTPAEPFSVNHSIDMYGHAPESYFRDRRRLEKALRSWHEQHPDAVLRWKPPLDAPLIRLLEPEALQHLCDSPDAIAMLTWANEKTGECCTLSQARAALERIGLIKAAE